MNSFPKPTTVSLPAVREVIEDLLRPGHFYLAPDIDLERVHQPREEISWEIYKGRLLDPTQTRRRQAFEAWNIYLLAGGQRSAEPILSLKLDFEAGKLHVLRAVHCYAWEGYDAGGNIFLSRETTKWMRELVGTLELSSFRSADESRAELISLLFNTVVGTGRLALVSVEMPLPAFSFGQLAYFYRPEFPSNSRPMRGYQHLLNGALTSERTWRQKIKLFEILLRSATRAELGAAADFFARRWQEIEKGGGDLIALFRGLFDEVSLTPYTDFAEKALIFLDLLAQQGHVTIEARIDFLSFLLRHIVRHLTAYDLVTFHHRGANYPDGLLLDAVLKAFLKAIEDSRESFADIEEEAPPARTRKRIRRRALRQAWLLRRRYEGHPVPDVPTSPGENNRVLPPPHIRVPEEQILNPTLRIKKLFTEDPLDHHAGKESKETLRQSMADLRHPVELQELGMALFLDRPLGVFKATGEPDQTLLFSYEAFSKSIAERRLRFLVELDLITDPKDFDELSELLHNLAMKGIPLVHGGGEARPGTVSIADARKVADDFVFLRTTKKSVSDFLSLFRFESLASKIDLDYLTPSQPLLIMRSLANDQVGVLLIYDAKKRKRLELQIDPSRGYRSRAGVEHPAAGLPVLRAWKADGPLEKLALTEEEKVIRIDSEPAISI